MTEPVKKPAARLRVLWVNDHIGHSKGVVHGAARYFVNLLHRFNTAHIDLTVAFLGEHHPIADELSRHGVEPVFLGRRKWDPRAYTDLLQLAMRGRYHVMHMGGHKSMLLGRMVARVIGAKSIIHVHDVRPMPWWLRLAHHRMARFTDVAIGVSGAARQFAIDGYGVARNRAVVLHNAIVVEQFADVRPEARADIRRELGIAPDASVVGMIGRVIPAKGHELVIRQLPWLLTRCPNAVAMVVGDGEGRPACEQMAHELGVSDAVRFVGQRSDVPELLAAMDAVALPAPIAEAYSLTTLEALAAGRPVVAFDSDGMSELVTHEKTGLLVPPQDRTAFIEGLAQLLTDTPLRQRMAHECQHASERFSIREHARKLEHLYDAAVFGLVDEIEAYALGSHV